MFTICWLVFQLHELLASRDQALWHELVSQEDI
jgi:hypothetical protein